MRLRDLVWPVALSLIVIVAIVAFTTDGEDLLQVAQQFRPGLLLLAVLMLGLQIGIASLRLRHIAKGALTYTKALRGQVTWDFLSSITPSALGGGPFAAYFIAKENGLPYGQVTAYMLFSMLMDQVWFALLIVTLFILATWLPVFPTALGVASIGTVALYLIGLLTWVSFFAYATLVRPQLIEWVAGKVVRIKFLRRFEDRVQDEARKLRRQARILRSQPASFYLKGFAMTAGLWMSRYAIALYAAFAVASIARPVLFYLRTAALWLVGIALPTPGGSGGMEGLYLLFLAPLLPEGAGGPALLGWRFIAYYAVLVIGAVVAGSAVSEVLFGRREAKNP
ncbi:MAG: lysylphosphatidylglycerol synthase transmembrane domain-containing protein [Bacteroidota bacterium]